MGWDETNETLSPAMYTIRIGTHRRVPGVVRVGVGIRGNGRGLGAVLLAGGGGREPCAQRGGLAVRVIDGDLGERLWEGVRRPRRRRDD